MTTAPANRPFSALPPQCDVLVIGAGPSGSACARWLAQAGWQVVLVDAQRFPRDKTCGDGLVPDAHAALRRLGLLDQVLAVAQRAGAARCVAPSGAQVDVAGDLAVLPRRTLDDLLCRAAVAAGALHVAPARFVGLLHDATGRVTGATLAASPDTSGNDLPTTHALRAPWVVLATGAGSAPLLAAGVCERRSPSGMAVRAYVHHPDLADAVGGLRFVWHPRLRHGYGWIFAGPDGVYNIGTGVLPGHHGPDTNKPARSLRQMMDDFAAVDPVAARLLREGTPQGPLKGAPLRCDLEGARWAAPGLLVVGDAAGATYAFSGEGIGKALETGLAAAEALLAHAREPGGDTAVQAAYTAALQTLKPRFEMYRQAASFNRFPWLINLMVWRARQSPRVLAKLSDILNERRLPGSLLTWRGVRTMLLP